MVRPPQPPVYLFVLDTSYAAVNSGMLRCVTATLAHTLERLPGISEGRTQVGILTFDSTLHFYNLSASSPQMLVAPEIDEVRAPSHGAPRGPLAASPPRSRRLTTSPLRRRALACCRLRVTHLLSRAPPCHAERGATPCLA